MLKFQRGNSKLGRRLHSWSLPARRKVCVGATTLCSKECYAKRGHFHRSGNQDRYEANLQKSRRDDFVEQAIFAIQIHRVKILRIHVSGEFYSARYIAKWVAIARACPRTQFFAYTRAYRQAALLPGLRELAQLANFTLWFSEDRETLQTGRAPAWPGVGRAFMVSDAGDELLVPTDAQLVFRNRPKQVRKRLRGVLVCPVEQGVRRQVAITCSRCQLCFSQRLVRGAQVAPTYQPDTPHDAAPVPSLVAAGF